MLPPGPPALPLLGHLPNLRAHPLGFLTGMARRYGPATTLRLGRQTTVLFSRPEAVRSILIDHAHVCTSAEFNAMLRPVLGRGLLTTDGADHRRLRRLVQPAFGRTRVAAYRDLMVAHTERLLATWHAGATFDMAGAMQKLTLGIMAEVLLGIEDLAEAETLGRAFEDAATHARQASLLVRLLARPRRDDVEDDRLWRGPLSYMPATPQHRLAHARATLDGIVTSLLARHRADVESRRDIQDDPAASHDVVSALMEARDADGGALSDVEIRDQLLTLLAAGHATTAVALSWTFYLLSRHPRAVVSVLDELRRVLAGRPPTVSDLENLPYLDHVWTEALRLYPPAWAIGRFTHAEVHVAGYDLPAGTLLMVSPWVTHRLPDLFPDPVLFRPERWDQERPAQRPPYAYFPFGAGPRMCVGAAFAALEAKVVLATILQRAVPRLVSDHPVVPAPIVVLRPAGGMRVTMHPADY